MACSSRARRGLPRLLIPGSRDMRGYQAMYGISLRANREGRAPQMSLERAMEDHRLMDQIYAGVARPPPHQRWSGRAVTHR